MAPINKSKYQYFIEKLQRDNPVWANNPNEIRLRIAKLDQFILDVVNKHSDPALYQKWAGEFFFDRNCLARHIGDAEKEWADYEKEVLERQRSSVAKKQP